MRALPFDDNPMTRASSRWAGLAAPVGLVAALSLVALAIWFELPTARVLYLMSEEGPIEQATVWGFCCSAIALLLWRPRSADWRTILSLAVMLGAFGVREMDWHKAWTGTSVLRVSFYYGAAPLAQKLTAAAALAVVIGALGWLVRSGLARWLHALRADDPAALALATFLLTMIASKGVDRSLNLLTDWVGWLPPPWLRALQLSLEETWELALPVLACMALARWRRGAVQPLRSTKTVSTPV